MFEFILNPYYRQPFQDASLKEKCLALVRSLSRYVSSFIIIIAVVAFVDILIVQKLLHLPSIAADARKNAIDFQTKLGIYKFAFVAVFLAPLVEESIFRLPLSLTKQSMSIAAAVSFYRFSDNHIFSFDYSNSIDWLRLMVAVSIFLILRKYLSENLLSRIRNTNFKYLFYASAIFFGLIHINNFCTSDYRHWIFYPFYVLPQISMGLFFGNLRMQYGFLWGCLMHALINLMPILFSILS
jgi:membrane protease YdiL (CAAX protease family)